MMPLRITFGSLIRFWKWRLSCWQRVEPSLRLGRAYSGSLRFGVLQGGGVVLFLFLFNMGKNRMSLSNCVDSEKRDLPKSSPWSPVDRRWSRRDTRVTVSPICIQLQTELWNRNTLLETQKIPRELVAYSLQPPLLKMGFLVSSFSD